MNNNEIIDKMSHYNFYHIIDVADGITTPGYEVFVPQQNLVMDALYFIDFIDKKVLDIGCRDGLFSFRAEESGAGEVIGIDNNLSTGAIEFLIPIKNSKVKMFEKNIYDLTQDCYGCFDIVIFSGVLYHLRFPFLALKIICDVLNPGARVIIETGVYVQGEKDKAMLYCPIGDESPYEPTSCTFFNEKGLCDTLLTLGLQVDMVRRQHPFEGFPHDIDRCVFLCTYKPDLKTSKKVLGSHGIVKGDELTNYWHGTHEIHKR